MPLIATCAQACSDHRRKASLTKGNGCWALLLISLHPGVFSPIGNALCLHNTAAALLRLCSLISHISCVAPFCRDILITGVSPDPTCSSQSRLSCFFSFQCWRRFWLKSFVTIVTTHIDLGMTLRLPSFNYLFIHCIGFHTENLSLRYFCIMY